MKHRIKVGSAKAKARELQCWVCQQISDLTGYEWGTSGQDKPIESRPMGQHGPDVRLESQVQKLFPFAVETKRQEHWSVPGWVRQAKKNQKKDGVDWLLIARQSNSDPVAIIDAEVFFRLLPKHLKTIKRRQGKT